MILSLLRVLILNPLFIIEPGYTFILIPQISFLVHQLHHLVIYSWFIFQGARFIFVSSLVNTLLLFTFGTLILSVTNLFFLFSFDPLPLLIWRVNFKVALIFMQVLIFLIFHVPGNVCIPQAPKDQLALSHH